MKKIFSIIIFVFVLNTLTDIHANNINILKEQIKQEHDNFPIGDLNDVEFVKKIINQMFLKDQEIRQYFIKYSNDSEFRDLVINLDRFNTLKMKEILSVHGWVSISKFGANADDQAWLLVQHADHDPFFQAGCLFILGTLIDKAETVKKNYAFLYDRVALKFPSLGLKQKYGTQVKIENNKFELLPHEGSIETLNIERGKMGLNSIEEYMEVIKKLYDK
ncbi:MAG: hypothetical protein Q8L85_00635 [Alphaproteobacteria bacterium]|nr:hypothetical protein [Alphaproteobacteria bacterium]